ncbi:hypothetical protein [Nocardia sp. NPDC048505]|uniref:hypothetical protein n=1 Tax=unclassified Nocardia TaxID=2637762 RepID=UPI0033F442A9
MADTYSHDLAANTIEVLNRRAARAGLGLTEYLRHELVDLARRRNSIDTVVEFLDEEGWPADPTIDTGALHLLQSYNLPAEVVAVWCRRAFASKLTVDAFVRQELTASARRTTVEDALAEFSLAKQRDPRLDDIDMAAVEEAVRFARGW